METVSLTYGHTTAMAMCQCGAVFQASGTSADVATQEKAFFAEHRNCEPLKREGVKTFWLSFCDNARPKGSQFLGACVVDVTSAEADDAAIDVFLRFPLAQPDSEWIAAAVKKAHAMKCNPGGEVATAECTEAPAEWHAAYERNRLYSRADVAAIDAKLGDV